MSKDFNDPFAGLKFETDQAKRLYFINPATGRRMFQLDEKGEIARDAEGNPIAGYAEFLSTESEKGRAWQKKTNLKRMGRRKELSVEDQLADMQAEGLEQIVELCTGWYLVAFDGRHLDVPFTAANVRAFFGNPHMAEWRRQASGYIGEVANFMPASSQVSSPPSNPDSAST